jgi:hypothetical protein
MDRTRSLSRKLQLYWGRGAMAIILLGLVCLTFGAVALPVVIGLGWLAGVAGLSVSWETLLWASALVWAPLAVGYVLPTLFRHLKAEGRMDDEMLSLKR